MNFARSSLVSLALLTVFVSPAQAAIDKAGADKLKTIVNSFITEQKKLSEINGATKIEFQGETTVEEAGDYYAVTLPYTKILQPNGEQIDVGMISINASPGDSEGQWKMRVAVPTPIVITDKAGAELTRMTIGGQRAAGIWDESLRSFIKLDALYKDVLFSGTDGSSFKIPETQILYDFTKDAANKWSGPGTMTFKNIEAIPKNGAGLMKAAEIKVGFTIDQYDSNAIRKYREKLAALSETMAKDAAIPAGKISPAHTGAIANMLADFLSNAGNGMNIRYDVTDLSISKPAIAGSSASNITIPKGFFGLDLSGLNKGSAKLALLFGYDNLAISPNTGDGLTPTESNVEIIVENIPVRSLLELGKNTLDSAIENPTLAQQAQKMLPGKIFSLFSQSGSFITVNNTHMGNADIDIKMEGRARADASAVMSGTANTKVSVRGLDTLITRLQAQAAQPGNKNAPQLQQTIQQLTMFKMISKTEGNLNIVNFELTPQGAMTINGQPLAQALMGAQAKPADATPAPVPPVTKTP